MDTTQALCKDLPVEIKRRFYSTSVRDLH
ncbi:MAG: hypothetical protein RJA41_734, partial [Actinomycetota bacterium]